MSTENGNQETKIFHCVNCGLTEKYTYYGKNPPFAKPVNFSDDSYVIKDPFSPPEEALFLLLGSTCCVCGKAVCQSQECSIYYEKRFCISCCKANFANFPEEIKKEITKKGHNQK